MLMVNMIKTAYDIISLDVFKRKKEGKYNFQPFLDRN
jgi:hypothetical protein